MAYPSILIKDTTREERERIVAESLGDLSGMCDGCSPGLAEMYQDYIDGKREIREINMAFRASYVSGDDMPERDDPYDPYGIEELDGGQDCRAGGFDAGFNGAGSGFGGGFGGGGSNGRCGGGRGW